MRKLAPLAIIVALALACVASANLLVNPGFEIGAAGGQVATNWWDYDGSGVESWAWRSGTNGYALQGWNNGWWGWFGQDVSSNMIVGDVITFSIWGLAESGFTSFGNEAYMALELWTNGAATYTVKVTNNIYWGLTGNRENWAMYTLSFTNSIAGLNLIKPLINSGGWTSGLVGNQALKFDDADLTIAIPEPTMAAMLGFAGLIFLAARRMVRK